MEEKIIGRCLSASGTIYLIVRKSVGGIVLHMIEHRIFEDRTNIIKQALIRNPNFSFSDYDDVSMGFYALHNRFNSITNEGRSIQ